MTANDDVGNRGEALFVIMLNRFCGRRRPFFRPHFLGAKFVAIDHMVELVDAGIATPFFFVQVKTTTKGYRRDRSGNLRLRVAIPTRDMERLVYYPAPTYIVGIDEVDRRGYIVSADHDSPKQFSSLPTDFPLDCENLEKLWEEANLFWQVRDMRLIKSHFGSHTED